MINNEIDKQILDVHNGFINDSRDWKLNLIYQRQNNPNFYFTIKDIQARCAAFYSEVQSFRQPT